MHASSATAIYLWLMHFSDARSCTTCDKVLQELEQIDDDTDSFGVDFVKINDKRLAKHYGITKFPALTYFREKKPIIYEGKLTKNRFWRHLWEISKNIFSAVESDLKIFNIKNKSSRSNLWVKLLSAMKLLDCFYNNFQTAGASS